MQKVLGPIPTPAMTTIGPGAMPLERSIPYMYKAAKSMLGDLIKNGIKPSSVITSLRPELMGKTPVHIDADPNKYLLMIRRMSDKQPLSAAPGRGTDASMMEMLTDDLVKHFSGSPYDPFSR